eukprot:TRINITY_DN2788_c0_g1_i2.p1 TRINITY_DN2788_c0_g1~~TRINITY_DN2788_c0_g1_i2.p1  ORF type:complete len:550 (-),score=106.09 TRINITY_DN2788_c0_g1_i2:64-1563(-)
MTYQQRYFYCDQYWNEQGPIFFYTGNEADVTLYLNATGLMWENAPSFHALLVFAEHRYFGKSLPFGDSSLKYISYLTPDQALADYATLIYFLRSSISPSIPVIAFGGSYGGMLASWLRIKYSSAVDGAIAASAPILSFLGEYPPFNSNSFSDIETADATPKCRSGIRASWDIITAWAQTPQGRANLSDVFRLCSVPPDADTAVSTLFDWASGAVAYMAMGDYPYSTSYITNGGCMMPPWPMNVGCAYFDSMSDSTYMEILSRLPSDFIENSGKESHGEWGDRYPEFGVINGENGEIREVIKSDIKVKNDKNSVSPSKPFRFSDELTILQALRDFSGVFYNCSGTLTCFDTNGSVNNATLLDGLLWDYLYCSVITQPFSSNGITDMFWSDPFNLTDVIESCQSSWGITPRPYWATINYGGKRLMGASNIVFSNGVLDPWHGSGVLTNVSESVVAVLIPQAAHHLDLMFSNQLDPVSVVEARKLEVTMIKKWIEKSERESE